MYERHKDVLATRIRIHPHRTRWHTWAHELSHVALVLALGEEVISVYVRERFSGGYIKHYETNNEAVVSVAGIVGDFLSGGLVPADFRVETSMCFAEADRRYFAKVIDKYNPIGRPPVIAYEILDEVVFDPTTPEYGVLSGGIILKGDNLRLAAASALYDAYLVLTGVWGAIKRTADAADKDNLRHIHSRNISRLNDLRRAVDKHKDVLWKRNM